MTTSDKNMKNPQSEVVKAEEEAEVMNEVLQVLQKETPKIDQSVKNLLSVMMGRYSSLTIDAKMKNVTPNSPSSSSSASVASNPSPEETSALGHTVFTKATINIEHFHQKNLFSFAKVLLNSLQETNLPGVSEFLASHPQGSEELGMQYLDKILNYKGIYFLRQKIIQEKQKVSKYFGKSYFLFTDVWSVLKEQVHQRAKTIPDLTLTSEEIDYLLAIYEKSIFGSEKVSEKQKKVTGEEEGEGSDYHELIWAKDFQQTLQEYQRKRQEQIEARKHEKQTDEENEEDQEDNREENEGEGAVLQLI